MTAPLLSIRGVETYYGNIRALKGVDLDVNRGEIVTLISLKRRWQDHADDDDLRGQFSARSGKIIYDGTDITKMKTHEIMHLIAHSPEGRRIFPRMTVYENLLMGTLLAPEGTQEEDLATVFKLFRCFRSSESTWRHAFGWRTANARPLRRR